MKLIVKIIAIWFSFCFVLYSAISFYELDINFVNWNETQRGMFATLSLFVMLFCSLIISVNNEKD